MIRDPIAPLRPDLRARSRRESPQQDVAPAESTEVAPAHRVQQPRVRKSAHLPQAEPSARAPTTRRHGEQGIDVVGDSLPELLNRINVSGAEAAVREDGPSRVQIASLGRSLDDQAALVARLRIKEGRLAAPTSAARQAEVHEARREAAERDARRESSEDGTRIEDERRQQAASAVRAVAEAAESGETPQNTAATSERSTEQDDVSPPEGAAPAAPPEAAPPPHDSVAPPGSLVDVLG